jgi:ComF family protein
VGTVSRLIHYALDLVLPPECAGCGTRGSVFCTACRRAVLTPAAPLCWRCGRPLLLVPPMQVAKRPPLCPVCADGKGPNDLTQLRAVGFHEGPLREAVHALKYEGRRQVAGPLGEMLARYLQDWAADVDVVIPVPLHRIRRRRRGFNQADLLARHCAEVLRLPYLPRALVRKRATRPQVGLSLEERRSNVAGAFKPGRQGTAARLAGKHVLLIDDVTTTGSTLNAAAAALAPLHPISVRGMALTRPVPRWQPTTHLIWPDNRG